ncbi:MAG: ATP-dependent metallopeptidase FtsH/Yme1/Tma family protein [candidate division Zixibacteria bacterium]|nr:ATP-dependent metallopeptidase FtsH/Yme1/Tma family protein [candidate division Zixibacteria bacterium]
MFWVALITLSALLVNYYSFGRQKGADFTYSEFLEQLDADNVVSVTVVEHHITGEFKVDVLKTDNNRTNKVKEFRVLLPMTDTQALVARLETKKVQIKAEEEGLNWTSLLLGFAPWVLILVFFWLFMFRQMQSGPKGIFSFGKSRARVLTEDRPKVTFSDVAGAEEAKAELEEVIDFLRDPGRFQRLGGKIPKGVLLLGPPGTGKTLLARAVAGEASVPFFSMSGSDFVEMFVGVGASRVRDLFEQGKRSAPCIIFIDEIDAVGRHRGAGLGGGHDEREQTLNQLLVEMDGFESNEGVILLAATNRPDVLDPALLRPGRFDRQVVVDAPDVRGREGILKVHTRKIALSANVDLKVLARGTPGLSGADIANLVNEAALLAARRNRDKVEMEDFENAKDKVMMGTERRSLVITPEEKKTTAYHEAGHALVGKLTPNTDPVHKVTIIPRGMALGVTHFLPIDERHTHSKEYLEARLMYTMGGRVAEKLVFNQYTTGAGNDLERATALAHKMVCEWGMSDALGAMTFGKKQEEIFLGREIARHRDYSERTAQKIDDEVKRILAEAEAKATQLLSENLHQLHAVAKALLEREILDGDQIDVILRGEELSPIRESTPPPAEPTPVIVAKPAPARAVGGERLGEIAPGASPA